MKKEETEYTGRGERQRNKERQTERQRDINNGKVKHI
jgi:hypothetical protein